MIASSSSLVLALRPMNAASSALAFSSLSRVSRTAAGGALLSSASSGSTKASAALSYSPQCTQQQQQQQQRRSFNTLLFNQQRDIRLFSIDSALAGSIIDLDFFDFDEDEHDNTTAASLFKRSKASVESTAESFFREFSSAAAVDTDASSSSSSSSSSSTSSSTYDETEDALIKRASKKAAEAKREAAALTANAIRMAVDDGIKRLLKKRASLDRELQKALSLEELARRATLITANLFSVQEESSKVLIATDWENNDEAVELHLGEGYKSFKDEAAALFKKARKIRRGTRVVEGLLDEIDENLDYLATKRELILDHNPKVLHESFLSRLKTELKKTGLVGDIYDGTTFDANSVGFAESKAAAVAASSSSNSSEYREFISPQGYKIFVGKNRAQNEKLAISVAKKDDVWFHVRGIPGAHVVLKSHGNKQKTPTDEDLQMCADLAAYYSDYRTSNKVDVTMAEPKHIIKPPKAPLGAVTLRKEKGTILANPSNVEEKYMINGGAGGRGESEGWEGGK
jgi:predicted ribosome quality control (RQC) complex YloA/Tae2 family protein